MESLATDYGLWGLLISAFVSSTLLPGGSEVLLLGLALTESHSRWSLLGVATLSNTLGGMTSWGIGRWLTWRFPGVTLERHGHKRAAERLSRWGAPALLLSWLPVIGDPLCVAAGWLRIHWGVSLLFIALGKGARYALLLWWI